MTEYLIAFNDEWVPDLTVEDLREKSKAARALVAEMKAAGVFIFTGGLDDAALRVQCRCVERHAAVHRRSVRRDQGAPRRLRRRGCGRRGGGAAVGGEDRGGLRLG